MQIYPEPMIPINMDLEMRKSFHFFFKPNKFCFFLFFFSKESESYLKKTKNKIVCHPPLGLLWQNLKSISTHCVQLLRRCPTTNDRFLIHNWKGFPQSAIAPKLQFKFNCVVCDKERTFIIRLPFRSAQSGSAQSVYAPNMSNIICICILNAKPI